MASISDIVQQYTDMRQGLKQLHIELDTHWRAREDEAMEKELEENDELQKTNIEKVSHTAESGINEDTDCLELENKNEASEGKKVNTPEDGSAISEIKELSDKNEYDEVTKDARIEDETAFEETRKEEPTEQESSANTDSRNAGKPTNERTLIAKKRSDRFFVVMNEYESSALGRFEELEALYVNVDATWKDVMSYYGENPRNTQPDEFFNIFAKFISNWKAAAAEEESYSRQLELEEQRKKKLEDKKSEVAATSKNEESHDNDRRLMDDLLEQLRSGETDNKLRQRRVRQRLKRLKNAEPARSKLIKRLSTSSTVVLRRRSSSNSSVSSLTHIPVMSAEKMLRELQQEDDY